MNEIIKREKLSIVENLSESTIQQWYLEKISCHNGIIHGCFVFEIFFLQFINHLVRTFKLHNESKYIIIIRLVKSFLSKDIIVENMHTLRNKKLKKGKTYIFHHHTTVYQKPANRFI